MRKHERKGNRRRRSAPTEPQDVFGGPDFPVTDDPERVGFIAADGRWISLADYDGYVEPPYRSERTVHHAEAAWVLLGHGPIETDEEAEGVFEQPAKWVHELHERTGAMRVFAHSGNINIGMHPGATPEQVASVTRLAREYEPDRVGIDVCDGSHRHVDALSVVSPDRIAVGRALRDALSVSRGEAKPTFMRSLSRALFLFPVKTERPATSRGDSRGAME